MTLDVEAVKKQFHDYSSSDLYLVKELLIEEFVERRLHFKEV